MKKIVLILLSTSLFLSWQISSASNDDYRYSTQYKVTVTNLTKGESFTPILAATHKKNINFFTPGEPASPELSTLAESGNIAPLNELLGSLPNLVKDTSSTEGLLEPGGSVSFTITGSPRFNRLSIAAMLIPTNDTFFALNTKTLPRRGQRQFLVYAYDAGTETNDELCANIPGLPCFGLGDSLEDEGEGYVYISPGIHGEGDLARSKYDWRNPVARVVVRRVYY